jgi:putative nucleotidyltransferase with HDIG domain
VKLIGLDTIKALALGSQIFTEMNVKKEIFSVEGLWKHSLTVGSLAKKIAECETAENSIINGSFIAGILHDIGKLILVSKMEPYYCNALGLAREENIHLSEAEKKIFQSTHCAVGAYLIGLWGFPSDVVEAIGFHHRLEEYPADTFTPALAVHIANVMYYQFHQEEVIGAIPACNQEYLVKLGLAQNMPIWRDICVKYMEQLRNGQL